MADYQKRHRKKKKRKQNEAMKLWRQVALQQRGENCELCGRPNIQVHHFFPRQAYPHLMFEPENAVVLCAGCHWKHHNGDPQIQQRIIEKRGDKWYNELEAKGKNPPKGGWKTLKWFEEKKEELEEILSPLQF